MVCNLVTYRARSAVREVGYALGFPRPLVDRVAKALETYDSVMVRRDLEADGGFAEFFRRTGEGLPGEALAAEQAGARGLVDGMGELQQRVPLVGKIPPWRQPPTPEDPNAPRPFAWLREAEGGHEAEAEPFREDPLAPVTTIRPGGPSDDEGGPGDSPASVAWLRAGRGTGYPGQAPGSVPVDPDHGMPLPPPRKTDRLGRPSMWDPPPDTRAHSNSVARVELDPPPQARGGSTRRAVALGALARVLRPHRRLPAPSVDPRRAACS